MNNLTIVGILLGTLAAAHVILSDDKSNYKMVNAPSVRFQDYHYMIDVRSGDEYAARHIIDPRIKHIEGLIDYPKKIEYYNIQKDSYILIMCNTGNRAMQIARELSSLGYTNLRVLNGSFEDIADTTLSY